MTGTVEANKSFIPEAIYALPSGNYRLKLSAKDTQGRECTASKNFLLFSLNDKRPPFVITDWFYQDGLEFDAASPATIYIGSSERMSICFMMCLQATSAWKANVYSFRTR